MKIFNSYWPVYKNLEEDTLQLTKYINFSDDQVKVYSMHIADLIIKIVVEIESLSKELYKNNGGPDVFDENGNLRDLFFDTDCINYLNDKWGICNRDIIVSCANFNFTDENYKIFKPLKKANKRGTSGAKWKIAYQAVKHDRRNNLTKGNVENLIQALGALYILNIYYKDDISDWNTNVYPNTFDNRLGSNIFAASFADASKVCIGNDASDNAIIDGEKKKIPNSLCIIKYKDESWAKIHKEAITYNNKFMDNLKKDSQFIKMQKEGMTNPDAFAILVANKKNNYVKNNFPTNYTKVITSAEKEVILNKGKPIYKIHS